MSYFITIIVTIICGCLGAIALDIDYSKKIPVFYSKNLEAEEKEVRFEKSKIISIIAVVCFLSAICAFKIVASVSDPINLCKMLISLIVVVGSACFDYREHRIPNIFPLILSLSGIVLLVIGFIVQQNGAMSYVISSSFAAVGCAICLTVASALTGQGIGAGDIKLMSALALVGGVYLICGVLFYSVIICAIVAVILLIFRKKSLKEAVPFGPFILLGYVITIFMSIY
ncbi:MAG: prepilin peptidase [Agathobacter sp.]|nr:prepilin peptidase [Agathobacter sp.]